MVRPARAAEIKAEYARLEAEVGGRLGVAVIDTGSGARLVYRGDERFPMCSTFKVLAAGAILARVDAGAERLDRPIPFTAVDLVTYSPVTKQHTGASMTLGEICEAAITMSDNTAGNLMLGSLGGPGTVTRFAQTLGDSVTRLDRTETELNEAAPGDPRDTTPPMAMAEDLRMLVFGDALSTSSRAQLAAWLRATKTGDAKLRAGVPAAWSVGDKTGGGDHGTVNDIAVIWPPSHPPVVMCVYMTETSAGFDRCNAAIAGVGQMIWVAGEVSGVRCFTTRDNAHYSASYVQTILLHRAREIYQSSDGPVGSSLLALLAAFIPNPRPNQAHRGQDARGPAGHPAAWRMVCVNEVCGGPPGRPASRQAGKRQPSALLIARA